ncbi:MAG: hypothetical protein K2I90_01500 [Odoribacter sp.]|nr:hypothetical protein [Odoribacter sp.]
MKTRNSSMWIWTLIAAVGLSLSACGNSQKKRGNATERNMAEQPVNTISYIETQTVVVVDSLAPDSTTMQKTVDVPKTN